MTNKNKIIDEDVESKEFSKKYIFVKAKSVPVRIRTGPGVNYGQVFGKYLKETSVEVSEIVPGSGSKKGWGKLVDDSGWVGMDFVEEVEG